MDKLSDDEERELMMRQQEFFEALCKVLRLWVAEHREVNPGVMMAAAMRGAISFIVIHATTDRGAKYDEMCQHISDHLFLMRDE